jgi:hypothetical protein
LHKPRYTLHDGFRMPMGFPVEGFASGLGYRPEAGDILLASYPKCGTTWAQHIIWLLLNDGKPLAPELRMTEVFPHLEEVGAEAVARLPRPRLIKTHLPFALTPWNDQARYIHVARNPFDCAVSFYHHTRGFVRHYDFADGRFEEFFECFIAGEVDFGDYFDHLVPWRCESRRENLLLLTYEDLRHAPGAAIAAIATFLGGSARRALDDDALAACVLEHSGFEAMSRDQQRWSSARPAGMPAFVRKGIVGDWQSVFTPDQARRLAAKFDERTAGTPAAALWPDVLAAAREWRSAQLDQSEQ